LYCHGQCNDYEGIKHGLNGTIDKERYKYCSRCEYFLNTTNVVCRCCGGRYRFKLQKRKLSRKERYQKNRETEINYSRRYYEEHREQVINRVMKKYEENREEYLEKFREYYKRKKELEIIA
jgi:hypothetical protein